MAESARRSFGYVETGDRPASGSIEGVAVKRSQLLAGLTVFLIGVMAGAAPVGATPLRSIPTGTTGADVSWPQCNGGVLGSQPPGASFGMVGVNDGLAGTESPCLSAELSWEGSLTYHAPVQVYVNTADPGNGVADWPTQNPSGAVDPYGSCTDVTRNGDLVGANSRACAWDYGYSKAIQDLGWVPSSSTDHWWLDVETDNTWQHKKQLGLNQADLDGMVAALPAHTVGVYSTSLQWGKIVGSSLDSHSHALGALPEWIPSGTDSAGAGDCSSLPAFTAGIVKFVQYTTSFNYDIACS